MFGTETYLEPNRTSKMEKIVNGFYTPGKRQKRVNVWYKNSYLKKFTIQFEF